MIVSIPANAPSAGTTPVTIGVAFPISSSSLSNPSRL